MRTTILATAALVAMAAVACADDESAGSAASTSVVVRATTTSSGSTSTSTSTTSTSTSTTSSSPSAVDDADVGDPGLRAELLAMLVQDQAVRTGVAPPGDDRTEEQLYNDIGSVDSANQTRLTEIFEQHGWPGWALVGKDGSTAAWAIVQHADLDLAYQERGLELLRAAVDAGDASKGDLAYLTDRVLVAKGEPQVYGTQWSPNDQGEWLPRTPIADEANVDARRAEAGLGTIAEYMDELTAFFES